MTDTNKIASANNRLVMAGQPFWIASIYALVVLWIVWPYVQTTDALVSGAALIATATLRQFIDYRFKRDSERDARAAYWEKILIRVSLAAGVSWGLSFAYFYAHVPQAVDPILALFGGLLVGGWSMVHVPSTRCIYAFAVPTIAPVLLAVLVSGSLQDHLLGMIIALFVFGILKHAVAVSVAYRASLEISEVLENYAKIEAHNKRIIEQDQVRLHSILNAVPTPVSVISRTTGGILYINRAGLDLFEIKNLTEVASNLGARFFADPADRDILFNKIISGEEIKNAELDLKRRDGTAFWLLYSANDMIYEGQTAVIGSFLDITERISYESELKDAQVRAESASRVKSEFLAHMSHEMRTPLNAVIGFSEVIRDQMFGPLGSPRYADYINDIHNSGVHLLTLINEILDLSRIEAGKFELQEDRVELSAIVDPVCRMLNERAGANKIALESHVDADQELWCDRIALTQVLINVIGNAIKFTEAGGSVTINSLLKETGDLVLTVTDTGIGIAAEDLGNVMLPFGQARKSSSIAAKAPGTGLGLTLSRSFVEMHGGTLDIISELGIGTKVSITLPAARMIEQGAVLNSLQG